MTDVLRRSAEEHGGRTALSDLERSWSYAELDRWVSELAERIREEDQVRAGDTLALIVDPTPEGVAVLLAAMRLGLTVAPLHPGLSEAERERAFRVLGEAGTPPPERASGTPSAILWTSGTTGRPRGVALTAEAFEANARASRKRLGLGPDDRWLCSLALAHVGGLALVVRAVILGSELVAVGPFDASLTSSLIDDGRVTHASLVPTQLLRILDHRRDAPPPPSFRLALVGGARAPRELVARALDGGWPVALTYGMTEATSQVATAPPELVRRRPDTVGPPLDGVEVRIAADGEVWVRGATLAAGYVGADRPLVDAKGWYHTGDLGALDDEGCLNITGRKGDRIISGGVTVDALEVEDVLRSHPVVADVAVVGLPDADWGEKVAAAVVPVEGEFDLEELDAYARRMLGAPKRPRRWLPVHELPRNPNGKVDRRAVRDLFG